MNRLLLASFIMMFSLGCNAESTKCSISEDMVKQAAPQNAEDIAVSSWESGRDKRSNEFLKTLHIVYKNGDHAVVQHKYCSMYNFEVVYFRYKQADDMDVESIGKVTNNLYEQFTAKKVKFSRPLAEIVSTTLKEGGFDKKKDQRVGLPEENANYDNERVEYSIRYNSLNRSSSIYSSVTTLYVGVGGMN